MHLRQSNHAPFWDRKKHGFCLDQPWIEGTEFAGFLSLFRIICGLRRFHMSLTIAGLVCFLFGERCFAGDSPAAKSPTPPGNFLNPLGDPPLHLQDPFILVHSKRYYLFGTASPSEGFQCYESADLVNWKLDGWAWRKSGLRVARGDFHAPQVFVCQGMFCLIYSARMPGGIRLALAASTKPEGPYHDLHVPWLSLGDSCSDGDVLIDSNSKVYLTFSTRSIQNGCIYSSIYGVALAKDLSKTIGEPVKLLEPAQRWELARRDSYQCNEAPRMFKIGSKYFITYSANDPASPVRAVGYASADKPLGPWTKGLENPILSTRAALGVAGLNRCSVFRSLDHSEWFVVYDTPADPANPSADHLVNLDKLVLMPNYKLSVEGPSRSPQPLPSRAK